MMMIKKWFVIIPIVLGLTFYYYFIKPTQQQPQLVSINSFHEVSNVLNRLGPDDIVFFDVDDTLLTAYDYLPRHFIAPKMFTALACIRYPKLMNQAYSEQIFSTMLQQAPRFLTEQSVTHIINKLRQQGTHVMVITGMESGSFGNIASMPAWRSAMLEQLGVSLSKKFENTIFENFKPSHRNERPCLYNGLICCNQRPKGEVVAAFLKHFNLKPSIVVHFDDSSDELVSVNNACLQRAIAPLCFHYRGAEKVKSLPWSTRRAFVQLNNLVANGQWLSDQEAQVQAQIKWINFF